MDHTECWQPLPLPILFKGQLYLLFFFFNRKSVLAPELEHKIQSESNLFILLIDESQIPMILKKLLNFLLRYLFYTMIWKSLGLPFSLFCMKTKLWDYFLHSQNQNLLEENVFYLLPTDLLPSPIFSKRVLGKIYWWSKVIGHLYENLVPKK